MSLQYHDVNRIANSLEGIARSLAGILGVLDKAMIVLKEHEKRQKERDAAEDRSLGRVR